MSKISIPSLVISGLLSTAAIAAQNTTVNQTPQANTAQPTQPDCQFNGCVYNAEEQLIGIAAWEGILARRMGGTLWYIGWTVENGFDIGFRLYFAVANCTPGAQPYLSLTGYTDENNKFLQQPPHFAIYYAGYIWGPAGAPEAINVKSYLQEDTNKCVNIVPYTDYGLSKMYYLDTVVNAAPFSLQ